MGNFCPKSLEPSFSVVNNYHKRCWVDGTQMIGDKMPSYSVYAGIDTDGDIIYVGRAYYNGDWLPAKIIANKRKAFISWNGKEYAVKKFEILVGKNFTWISCPGGVLPLYAVPSGTTINGDILYIGRGHWHGSLTPGKIVPSKNILYIPYRRKELKIYEYDALVRIPSSEWIPAFGTDPLPPHTVHAAQDSLGNPVYVGRAYHLGVVMPAKVNPKKKCAYVCYHGDQFIKYHFEVLCGNQYIWVKSEDGKILPNAVEGGHSTSGDNLFVGRVFHCGRYILGNIRPSHHCLYILYGNTEIPFVNYEILIKGQN